MNRVSLMVGLLITFILIDLFSVPMAAPRNQIMPTRPSQRFPAQSATLGPPPLFIVTLTLAEPSVQAVATQAEAAGAARWQTLALMTWQWLHLTDVHAQLIETLISSPYDAILVNHSVLEQNSITIRVQADRISQLKLLPGVVSLQQGGLVPRPQPGEELPGTPLPPFAPPGYN